MMNPSVGLIGPEKKKTGSKRPESLAELWDRDYVEGGSQLLHGEVGCRVAERDLI
jgi:hypothetical protein